ncbi:hypothetical protein CGGC5_v000866 [Colletotrichum fructicola Nara gc5]|uniref:Uncharacterized protein n=1 Tax=Colletotrichum fructicola (strain Nara gc5) TaxID=1213859 RepID=A0A7J6JJS5_COLFN|nr:hypothetical protein CFRS1_v004567 [Colletotrichum fructicola]KAF4490984.1 hypothetical protein CGGC5_v000866 [Colletotrichum fructicola Nara gc5]KAF4888859.1 hypothetical protein CGCFRS4_v009680 [Colletotrichum fructicola]KAF5515121.1 hypothetical protein CGCF413_v000839 [Colletotrichum fructicola]
MINLLLEDIHTPEETRRAPQSNTKHHIFLLHYLRHALPLLPTQTQIRVFALDARLAACVDHLDHFYTGLITFFEPPDSTLTLLSRFKYVRKQRNTRKDGRGLPMNTLLDEFDQ